MAVDYEERINIERMRRERREKAAKSCKKYELGGILCFKSPNIRYITTGPGAAWQGGVSGNRYGFLPIKGDPILFEIGMCQEALARTNPGLEVRVAIPTIGWYEEGLSLNEPANQRQALKLASQIKDTLRECDLSDETIGVDVLPRILQVPFDQLGINTSLIGDRAMSEARSIKTLDEVECLRMAASIVDACFARVHEALRPGVTERELVGIVHATAYSLGAEDLTAHCDSGPHTWPNMAFLTDRKIRPGDLVYLDIFGVSYLGYKTCYYRTFSCGRPTKDQMETYERVRMWLQDAIDTIRPGISTDKIAEKWPRAEEFGRPNEDAACLMQWGHGIGLSLYEPPLISRIWSLDYPQKVETGMTMAVETIGGTDKHTAEYPCGQGVRLEEMLHVTEYGVDVLSKWPIDELTICEL